jgi:hypothetical protein
MEVQSMKKVGGVGVIVPRGGFLWVVLGLALAAAPEVLAACDCSSNPGSYAWLVNSKMRFNNDSFIIGNVGANLPGGLVRFGRNSCQGLNELTPCAGNSVAVSADKIVIGELSSIAGSESNRLKLGPGAQVRNPPLFSVSLPLVSGDPAEVCGDFDDIACGGADVNVPELGNQVIPPGSYNGLLVGNGATITLGAGTYNFCSVKIGSSVQGNMDEATVLNVVGKFSVGSGTTLLTGGVPFVLNSEGTLVRLSQSSVIEAEVRAPFGKIKQQRASIIRGCACSDTLTADKGHGNICQTGSPSGAFVD